MNEGEQKSWDALVQRGIDAFADSARRKAELLDAVYDLWSAEARTYGRENAERSVTREFRLALRLTTREANTLMALAIGLRERLPQILACMHEGLLDQWRADQARDVFATLSNVDVAEADRRVAARLRELGRPLLWRAYLRRVADSIDAKAKQRRVLQARQDRYIAFRPGEDGVGTMFGRLPAEDIARCDARIDGIARSLQSHGDPRTLRQLRADVTADLILSNHQGSATTASGFTVNVHVPLGVALHLSEDGCRVDGYGELPADVARAMLSDPDNAVRKVLLQPDVEGAGQPGHTRYRRSRRRQEFAPMRDRGCRAPGCGRPIHEIDQYRHYYGCTADSDFQALCRLDHRLKPCLGWTHYHGKDGTTTIVTPAGRRYSETTELVHGH